MVCKERGLLQAGHYATPGSAANKGSVNLLPPIPYTSEHTRWVPGREAWRQNSHALKRHTGPSAGQPRSLLCGSSFLVSPTRRPAMGRSVRLWPWRTCRSRSQRGSNGTGEAPASNSICRNRLGCEASSWRTRTASSSNRATSTFRSRPRSAVLGQGAEGLSVPSASAFSRRANHALSSTSPAPARIQKVDVAPIAGGEPSRLTIQLAKCDRAAFHEAARQAGEAAPAPVAAALRVRSDQRPRPVVVIDPGHGGVDPGAAGVGGVIEKKITVDFALALAEQAQNHGPVSRGFDPIRRHLRVAWRSGEGRARRESVACSSRSMPTPCATRRT